MWGYGLFILFLFCLVCSALVEYKSISGKTLQESIEGEMSGDLEELLVAIGTFHSLRILLCKTPHCSFLMYGIMYPICEQSLHFSSNIMLFKNSLLPPLQWSVWRTCLPTLQSACMRAWRLVDFFCFNYHCKCQNHWRWTSVSKYALASLMTVRVVGRTSRLWTESWWVGPRSICWTSEPTTRSSTSTRCTLPSR